MGALSALVNVITQSKNADRKAKLVKQASAAKQAGRNKRKIQS